MRSRLGKKRKLGGMSKRATKEEHAREIERIHRLIDHIHKQAEALQSAAQSLPDGIGGMVSEKAAALLHTADELLDEVEVLEQKA